MPLPKAKQDGKAMKDAESKELKKLCHSVSVLAKSSYLLGQTEGVNAVLIMVGLDIILIIISTIIGSWLQLEGWWDVLLCLITGGIGAVIGFITARLLKKSTLSFNHRVEELEKKLNKIMEE